MSNLMSEVYLNLMRSRASRGGSAPICHPSVLTKLAKYTW